MIKMAIEKNIVEPKGLWLQMLVQADQADKANVCEWMGLSACPG
jgi:hypothetical protein